MDFRTIVPPEGAALAVNLALQRGEYVTGPWIQDVETRMATTAQAKHAVAVSSGTMALKIALAAIGVGQDDSVIVPDITFVACATVVLELGATPVFVDVDAGNFIMDRESTTQKMKDLRVKAIMAVRLGGEEVPEWVYEFGVPVIVDSAHSMDRKPSKAIAACYSFYPTKIVSGIEGGCIATDDDEIAAKAARMRLFGFEKGSRVASGVGYKGNMTNVSACVIALNLGRLGANLGARTVVRKAYNAAFGLEREGQGMYMVTVDDPDAACEKIPAIRHYPVPLSEMFKGAPWHARSKWVADHLVSIPMHEHMSTRDVDKVSAIIIPRLIKYESNGSRTVQR